MKRKPRAFKRMLTRIGTIFRRLNEEIYKLKQHVICACKKYKNIKSKIILKNWEKCIWHPRVCMSVEQMILKYFKSMQMFYFMTLCVVMNDHWFLIVSIANVLAFNSLLQIRFVPLLLLYLSVFYFSCQFIAGFFKFDLFIWLFFSFFNAPKA